MMSLLCSNFHLKIELFICDWIPGEKMGQKPHESRRISFGDICMTPKNSILFYYLIIIIVFFFSPLLVQLFLFCYSIFSLHLVPFLFPFGRTLTVARTSSVSPFFSFILRTVSHPSLALSSSSSLPSAFMWSDSSSHPLKETSSPSSISDDMCWPC